MTAKHDAAHEPRSAFAQWFRRARDGDDESLGKLIDGARQYLLRVAEQELGDDLRAKLGASDIVQETLLQAQQSFVRFRGTTEGELKKWLRQILLNQVSHAARHFRTARKRRLDLEQPLDAELLRQSGWFHTLRGGSRPDAQAIASERLQRLQRTLESLPQRSREAIVWRNYERQSFVEIGQRLGLTAAGARKLWLRAIEELRQRLEEGDDSWSDL
jgi:RNA polymerase sigma-70 factor (ECF subfamily)